MTWYRRERKQYYELPLFPKEKMAFIEVARSRLKQKNMKLQDLAKELGRPRQTIYNYFSDGDRTDKFLAAEIASYLKMDRTDWFPVHVEQSRKRVMEERERGDELRLKIDAMKKAEEEKMKGWFKK